jgi:hypothetical protein
MSIARHYLKACELGLCKNDLIIGVDSERFTLFDPLEDVLVRLSSPTPPFFLRISRMNKIGFQPQDIALIDVPVFVAAEPSYVAATVITDEPLGAVIEPAIVVAVISDRVCVHEAEENTATEESGVRTVDDFASEPLTGKALHKEHKKHGNKKHDAANFVKVCEKKIKKIGKAIKNI